MSELKVNCLVCGYPMRYVDDDFGPMYDCTECPSNMSVVKATALAALQQRLASLKELETAAIAAGADSLAHDAGAREWESSPTSDAYAAQLDTYTAQEKTGCALRQLCRKLAEQRKGDPK